MSSDTKQIRLLAAVLLLLLVYGGLITCAVVGGLTFSVFVFIVGLFSLTYTVFGWIDDTKAGAGIRKVMKEDYGRLIKCWLFVLLLIILFALTSFAALRIAMRLAGSAHASPATAGA
ncbi:MAG: hypothetical protein JWO96_859 [Candidatus Saccharibacteria bacterium]|nr:hypothetical protein [Candidatus Saccharibacteria bacterium]